MSRFAAIVRRDVFLALSKGGDGLMAVGFFLLAATLFAFGIGPDLALLQRIGPGILWTTALLAAMLSLDRMFQADFEDGGLDLLILTPAPLEFVALAKIAAHWLTTGLPLIIAAPVVAVLFHLKPGAIWAIEASLILGTPTLSLIGALGAALVLGARRGGVLVTLLVLPLAVPVLIFGAGAVQAAADSLSAQPHLVVLGGLLIAALVLCPWASAAALRQAAE